MLVLWCGQIQHAPGASNAVASSSSAAAGVIVLHSSNGDDDQNIVQVQRDLRDLTGDVGVVTHHITACYRMQVVDITNMNFLKK
jgi:hypothetical protein